MSQNKRESRQVGMTDERALALQKLREAKAGKSRLDQVLEVSHSLTKYRKKRKRAQIPPMTST